jgi:hypothetical protein
MRVINVSTSFARAEDDAAAGSAAPSIAFIEATMVNRKPEVGGENGVDRLFNITVGKCGDA